MSDALTPLIHIGYHKTASTWMQRNIFHEHSKSFWPIETTGEPHRSFWKKFIYNNEGYLLSPYSNPEKQIKEVIKKAYQQRPENDNRRPVISSERLSGNPHSSGFDSKIIAQRLKSVLPEALILILIREQKSFLLSNYLQYLSIGGKDHVLDYLERKYDGKRPQFSPDYIVYNDLIQWYYTLYQRENVLVLPYELLNLDPQSFIKEIEEFAGAKIHLTPDQYSFRENESKRKLPFFRLRKINHWNTSSSMNSFSRNNKLKRALFGILKTCNENIYRDRANEKLTKALQSNIHNWTGNRYEEQNIKLSKLISIDLSKYGYHKEVVQTLQS